MNMMNNDTVTQSPILRRWHYGLIALAVILTGFLLVHAAATLSVSVKYTPPDLTVISSTTVATEISEEARTAPFLFDRDTTTEHVIYAASQVVTILEYPQSVQFIKIHGPAPYTLTVQALDGAGAYQDIAGLVDLNLAVLPDNAWTPIPATTPVATAALRFNLVPLPPDSAITSTGLRELEIWNEGIPVNIKDGQALLAGLLSTTPPPQGRFYPAANASTAPLVGVIGPVASDDVTDNSFAFELNRDPAHFVRAYLTYELIGLAHNISVVRSINGNPTQGGLLQMSSTETSVQIEAINPDWLSKGVNSLTFAIAPGAAADSTYTVANVRVIAELDNGTNIIHEITSNQPDDATTNPISHVYDADLNTGWKPYPSDQAVNALDPTVEFLFHKPAQMDAVAFYLSAPIEGEMTASILRDGLWIGFPSVAGNLIETGWNVVPVPDTLLPSDRVIEGVRLTFTGAYRSESEVKELVFFGSGVGPLHNPPHIDITYPEAGQFYGRGAYIRGYVQPMDNGVNPAVITVGGQAVSHIDGAFGVWITKDQLDANTSAQGDADEWSVDVVASYTDADLVTTTVTKTVTLDNQIFEIAPVDGTVMAAYSETVSATATTTTSVSYDEAQLDVDAGAVTTDTVIGVTPLGKDAMPKLDPGMTNVTKGPRRGYRFTPRGMKFNKNIKVKLKYNKALVPPGHTEQDIKTYYFDEEAGSWKELERVTVDTAAKTVDSLTDHFTIMINAVVTVPDSPQAADFNPTSLKDIKAADPGAGVNLIAPPEANNMGDARLNYPIEVPAGRGGLQPQLAISYNSSGGNGWLGVGWDLSAPAITIDTRWGVPRYDTGQFDGVAKETETYMLNGEQLTPVAHRGVLQDRTVEKVFHTRVEGQFQKIIRHGNGPANYWWEVIDKNGTRNFYGGEPANGVNTSAILSDPNAVAPEIGNTFRWALMQTRDTNNNVVTYQYEVVSGGGGATGLEPWHQLYLKRIRYTGTVDPTTNVITEGPYEVVFNREAGRTDVTIDGRAGFKTVLDQRLINVEVNLTTETAPLIRRYDLSYDEGAFKKTLLTTMTQIGKDGITAFNHHSFEYYDEVRDPSTSNYSGFVQSSSPWTTGVGDQVGKSFAGIPADASAVSGTSGKNTGAALYVGFSLIPTKYISIGGKRGTNSSESEGLLAMVDIDGDGLPDKVFKDGGGLVYRRNTSGPNADYASITFGEKVSISGIGDISQERSTSNSGGAQGYFVGASFIADSSSTLATQSTYFTDANSDGLTDLVKDGIVYFNRLVNGVPTFLEDSTDTPVTIGVSSVDATGMLPDFSALKQEMIDDNPLLDSVRRWVAPYTGTVSIAGSVNLTTAPPVEYKTADGVRISIQHNGAEIWSIALDNPSDLAAKTIEASAGVALTVNVTAEDRLYFRVQSNFDGKYDEVALNPVMTYTDQVATTDVNQLPVYQFTAADDFIYGGRTTPIHVPFTGKLRISGDLVKTGITTDDISLSVYVLSKAQMDDLGNVDRIALNYTPVIKRSLAWDAPAGSSISFSPVTDDIAVEEKGGILLVMSADSNIDLSKIQWKPDMFYVEAFASTEVPLNDDGTAAVDDGGNPVGGTPGRTLDVTNDLGEYLIHIKPIYDTEFYPASALTGPQQTWSATQSGVILATPWPRFVVSPAPAAGTLVDTYVNYTAKRAGVQLSKAADLRVEHAVDPTAYDSARLAQVNAADELYFDFSTRDTQKGQFLGDSFVTLSYLGTQGWAALETGSVTINPSINFNFGTDITPTGEVLFLVRRGNEILAKQVVKIEAGVVTQTVSAFTASVTAGDQLYFDFLTRDSVIRSSIASTDVVVSYPAAPAWTAAAAGTVVVTPELSFNFGTDTPTGTFAFTVYKNGAAIGTQNIVINAGVVPDLSTLSLSTTVVVGDALTTRYNTGAWALTAYLTSYGASVSLDGGVGESLAANWTVGMPHVVHLEELAPSMLHRNVVANAFARPYRGWGYIGYNGNTSCAQKLALGDTAACIEPLIDETLLEFSTQESDYQRPDPRNAADPYAKPAAEKIYVAIPSALDNRWISSDERWWVTATSMSASRLGDLDYISVPTADDFNGAVGVPRISSTNQRSLGAGYYVAISGAESPGDSILDFMDMNGDRFPDVVGEGRIQYTSMVGTLESASKSLGFGTVRNTKTQSLTLAPGGTVPDTIDFTKYKKPKQESQNPDYGFSGSLGGGRSNVQYELRDVNGDGLPDRVSFGGAIDDTAGTLTVQLNLGYRFAQPEVWSTAGALNYSESLNASLGPSLGWTDGVKGWAGGLSLGAGINQTEATFNDINGDGLTDRIYNSGTALWVGFNTGTGFASPVQWVGGLSEKIGGGKSINFNGGVSFSYAVGPLCILTCWAIINPEVNGGESMARQEVAMRDVNGDGLPDHIKSTESNSLTVALNQTGRTNLLKKVYRPLGATVKLAYARSGNTYAQPQSRWVMTQVIVDDGHTGEGVDYQVTNYNYDDGYYDRFERAFYGYATLKQTQLDTTGKTLATLDMATPYRLMTRHFLTNSYYRKGLLASETIDDVSGTSPLLYTRTANTYELWNVDAGAVLADINSPSATVFPRLTRTDNAFYEGQPTDTATAGKTTYTTMGYDDYGNVTAFFDAGDTGTTDDVYAAIKYTAEDSTCVTPYIVGKASRIEVKNSAASSTLLRKRAATIDCASGTGNLTEVRQYFDSTTSAATNLAYLTNGNLQSVTGPLDANGQRTVMRYIYDGVVNTYPITIERSYDGSTYYSSTATYDYKYAQVVSTTDLNGNQMVRSYDDFGRLTQIYGPYEVGGANATIAFIYGTGLNSPVQTINPTTPMTQVVPHYALTQHLDKDANGGAKVSGTIDTVLIIDGLKRVLQTKKDAAVRLASETGPVNRMIVSGCTTFDFVGRSVTQRYPTVETKGSNTAFNPVCDTIPASETTYDALDRVIQAKTPETDTTFYTTSLAYGFGPDRNNVSQFETTVTDAKSKVKKTYKDVRGLITSVRETNLVGTTTEVIWTSYAYDPLKQIRTVNDALANVTTVDYDLLGRRTLISNPDTGPTRYEYDDVGNLTQKVTANLSAGTGITYRYAYNRLIGINYPNPDPLNNDITYTHGAPKDANNGAGRVIKTIDPSGQTDLAYGKLGEVVSEKRTVVTAVTPNTPEIYTTTFNFDTFGRLLRLTYPDGEVLTHTYDSGGNLTHAEGLKNNYRYKYLKDIHYDQFEQRVYSKAGNEVGTSYTYDPYTRRLATLNAGKGTLFQELVYTYDPVANITQLVNNAPIAGPGKFGGPSTQTYTYDDLHRLVTGEGTYAFAPNKTDQYRLDMAYSPIHNINSKNQAHNVLITQTDGSSTTIPQKKTSYDWGYAYNASGASSVRPHAPRQIGIDTGAGTLSGRSFSYDANGNQTGWTHDTNGTNRTMTWDDDNHLLSVSDNGHEKTYVYDAAGTRVIKRGPQGETVYVNQYFTVRNGTVATKHVYAGTTRFGSKMVKDITRSTNKPEKDLYYFHPDHLGSSSYVTDIKAQLYQHLEYFPFGETWIEEATAKQRTPYHYTAKELDEETGLYYYGARYYDPRTSVWQNPDPVLDKYLDGDIAGGGIYNSLNLGLYSYGHQRPIIMRDPDGNFIFMTIALVGAAMTAYDTYQTYEAAGGGEAGLRAAGKALVTDAAITIATGGVGKIASKLIPKSVKARAADAVGDIANKIVNKVKQKMPGKSTCSFAPDTLVMTQDGLKPIEQIKAGDYVLARDEHTGDQTWQKVLQHYNSLHNDIIQLSLSNIDTGESETVITTAEHPFYVEQQGWVRADKLKAGQIIPTAAGGYVKVGSSTWLQSEQLAYNMEVEQYHTYFVGTQQVWVHNECDERVRHFTNKKGAEGIETDNVIIASDQNKVFTVKAKGKPGSARDVEEQLGIKRGRGNNYVDFDASPSEFQVIKNPKTGATERVFEGDVDLTDRNPVFKENR